MSINFDPVGCGFLCPMLPGQGTVQVGFDLSPFIPPGTARIVQQYYESGISFTPIDPDAPFPGFVRRKGGGTPPPDWPDNGTAYLQAGLTESLKFSFVNGSVFGISSVDLAGWNGANPGFVLHFVGYRPDGSAVTESFSGNGNNFQTFYFGSEFSGLSRVEIATIGWSLDNLVISIPEPSTFCLFGLSVLFLGWRLQRKAGT